MVHQGQSGISYPTFEREIFMNHKEYRVSLEIAGPTAMWTRPDTGDAPVSYPVPTYGAVKGIFESVLLSEWAEVVPTQVEICKPIVYHNYSTNYGGPLRKTKNMRDGKNASYQLLATVLVDVCYRLYAILRAVSENYEKRGKDELQRQKQGTTNGAHAYQEVFERRLKKGKLFTMPCLGWKEFVPDYVGPFRPETVVCKEIDLEIPSMLKTCFPNGKNSAYDPKYVQNVKIREGVLSYAE